MTDQNKKKIKRNMATKDSKEFWESAKKTAKEVESWPEWKVGYARASINIDPQPEDKHDESNEDSNPWEGMNCALCRTDCSEEGVMLCYCKECDPSDKETGPYVSATRLTETIKTFRRSYGSFMGFFETVLSDVKCTTESRWKFRDVCKALDDIPLSAVSEIEGFEDITRDVKEQAIELIDILQELQLLCSDNYRYKGNTAKKWHDIAMKAKNANLKEFYDYKELEAKYKECKEKYFVHSGTYNYLDGSGGIQIARYEKCKRCNGHGQREEDTCCFETCYRCGGDGKILIGVRSIPDKMKIKDTSKTLPKIKDTSEVLEEIKVKYKEKDELKFTDPFETPVTKADITYLERLDEFKNKS